jgi:PBP1b-binding outer membrane lipoprotein LpoB
MKTRKFLFATLLISLTASTLFTSCRKNDEDNETGAATDNAFAEANFNDVANIADQAGFNGNTSTYRTGQDDGTLLSACATVTRDTANSSNPDTITVDFGSTNCLSLDGRYRRGKIVITYSGGQNYRDSGLVATIVPQNYFVNDNGISGTKTITNRGHITNGKLTWDVVTSGTVVLANNGGTITWNSTKTKVLLAGETYYNGPITWQTAKVGITGSANGTSAQGESFTANITSQLIRDFSCTANRKHFVQGTFDFTPGSRPTRTVDFGNGACDNTATVTINNNTYTITLR